MRTVPRWFVALCWALAVLFSLSVGLQINDPDPALWMLIYGAAALVAAFLPVHRIAAAAGVAVGLGSGVWGAYLGRSVGGRLDAGDLLMKMGEKGGAVEVGREAAGLFIIAVSLIALSAYRATRD